MGFDVSYHPISEDEVNKWYFDVLADIKNGNTDNALMLARSHGLDEFYVERYLEVLRIAVETTPEDLFEKTHGYYIAVIQGLFRIYFYTRGAAFTFLIETDDSFQQYTKPWDEILRVPVETQIENQIVENYCSGVFLPCDKLSKLLDDYANNAEVRAHVDEFFSHGRVDVLLKAARFAVENGLGILEATEVIEPDPLDLDASNSYSDIRNCDTEGTLLYRKEALSTIIDSKKPTPGIFSKLFGKKSSRQ